MSHHSTQKMVRRPTFGSYRKGRLGSNLKFAKPGDASGPPLLPSSHSFQSVGGNRGSLNHNTFDSSHSIKWYTGCTTCCRPFLGRNNSRELFIQRNPYSVRVHSASSDILNTDLQNAKAGRNFRFGKLFNSRRSSGMAHRPKPNKTSKNRNQCLCCCYKPITSNILCWFRDCKEDTLRLWLMALVLFSYMLMGCFIFSSMESSYEHDYKEDFNATVDAFRRRYPNVDPVDLRHLLELYGNATYNGFVGVRSRWDFYGALYFTWTVVSTVGYGMTTPHTLAGKMFLMLYGLLGCAGGILFFNLFLERVINLLANTLRWFHTRRRWSKKSSLNVYQNTVTTQKLIPRDDIKRGELSPIDSKSLMESKIKYLPEGQTPAGQDNIEKVIIKPDKNLKARKELETGEIKSGLRKKRGDTDEDRSKYNPRNPKHRKNEQGVKRDSNAEAEALEKWKPSVYWVLVILFLATCFIGCTVSILYSHMESWSYTDSLYFCFISFATIGFGDYVSNQKTIHNPLIWYKVVNFIILALGSCCTYSLLNVISIVIKQFLNMILKKVKKYGAQFCGCCCGRNANLLESKEKALKGAHHKKDGKKGGKHHKRHHSDKIKESSNVGNSGSATKKILTPLKYGVSVFRWKKRSGSLAKLDSVNLKPKGNITFHSDEGYTAEETKLSSPISDVATNEKRGSYRTPMYGLRVDRDQDRFNESSGNLSSPMFDIERKFSDKSEVYSRSPWRKDSGDMISVKDFMLSDKNAFLAEMQKHLQETSKQRAFAQTLMEYSSNGPHDAINNDISQKTGSESQNKINSTNQSVLMEINVGKQISTSAGSQAPYARIKNEKGASQNSRLFSQRMGKIPINLYFPPFNDDYELYDKSIIPSSEEKIVDKPVTSGAIPSLKSTNIIISMTTDEDEEVLAISKDGHQSHKTKSFQNYVSVPSNIPESPSMSQSPSSFNPFDDKFSEESKPHYKSQLLDHKSDDLNKRQIPIINRYSIAGFDRIQEIRPAPKSHLPSQSKIPLNNSHQLDKVKPTSLSKSMNLGKMFRKSNKKVKKQSSESLKSDESYSDSVSESSQINSHSETSSSGDEKLGGEEVGPLAILNKTLKEKH